VICLHPKDCGGVLVEWKNVKLLNIVLLSNSVLDLSGL
jgi:hypothetical protein